MKLSLYAFVLAASLIAPAAMALEPASAKRYEVELRVIEANKPVVQASTYISTGAQATLSLQGDQDSFEFVTNLYLQQGDSAEDRLVSEIHLVRNGVEIASPTLMMKSGGTARYHVGTEGRDEISVTVKPAS